MLKKVLIGVAALIGLILVAAIVLVATFDANRYKGVAIDWMKANRNRTLAIDGPIELSVFPRLAVRLSKLSLSEAGRNKNFAVVDAAALSVELLPLLRGHLVVDRVEANGVRATLTRDAKGRRNIDDLAGAPSAPAAPGAASAPAASTSTVSFDVSRVALRDVALRLRDEPAALDGELKIESLETGRLASGVTSPVSFATAFDFKSPALKGTLRGQAALTPQFGRGAVVLAELDLVYAGQLPGGLSLRELSVQARRLGYDPSAPSLEIDSLKLRATGDQAGAPISAELDWPSLQWRADQLKGSALTGKLERRGSSPASATFKTAALDGSADAMRIPGLEAQLATEAGGRQLAGSLRGQLAVQPPKQTAQWNLAGRLADNAFETNGSIAWAGSAPTLRAQMRFDALDLNTLLPEPAKAAAPAGSAPAASVDATPVDLSPLRSVNGSLNLRAAKLKVRRIELTETRLDATLEAGMLRIPTLQAKAWGGQIDANASADARTQRVALKANAAGIDIQPLLKDVADKDLLEGRGRVALDVASGGRTVGALRSALAGTASLQLRDGAVKGINLARTLRQAKAALSSKQDASIRASQTEKTDFSELSASFAILNGVARNSDLELKSPFLRLGGDGTIDIGRSQIDYTARATVVGSAAGQDAGELDSLKGLTIPVRLTGPLDAVDWKVQWSAVAASALKGKAEEKLKEKLGEKLGAPAGSASSPKQLLKEKLLKGLSK